MNKKMLVLLIVVIIISATVAVVTTFSLKTIERKEEVYSVKILAEPSIGTAPLNVSFSSLITNYKGDFDYQWDFGDGQTSEEKEPTIIYKEKGEYTCSLKVTDTNSNTAEDSMRIVVNKNKPPIVTLSINQNTINRDFNWLELLTLTPIASMMGNQQKFLDKVEEKKGANAWGEGRIVVTAQITDPEDDEIVSYDWKEQTADSLITISGKKLLPVHNLSGEKSVTIPELYTWIAGVHIVMLNVTDSAGNKASAKVDFMVSQSLQRTKLQAGKYLIFTILLTQFPSVMSYFWKIQKIREFVSNFLNERWLDFPPFLQNVTSSLLDFIKWNYEPPIPKAHLEFSEIDNINLSQYVNDTTGEVQSGAIASSSLIIFNNDSTNNAKNIYITLEKPFSNEQGLEDELETEDLTVEITVGIYSNKLFYNGKYTSWENSYNIVQLSPGDTSTIELMITIKEGVILDKGSYQCTLYIFQEKSLNKAEYVDEIPFTIII